MRTEEQVKGQIASVEAEISALVQQDAQQRNQFQQAIAQNQKRYNELQGELKAWKSMAEPESSPGPEPT